MIKTSFLLAVFMVTAIGIYFLNKQDSKTFARTPSFAVVGDERKNIKQPSVKEEYIYKAELFAGQGYSFYFLNLKSAVGSVTDIANAESTAKAMLAAAFPKKLSADITFIFTNGMIPGEASITSTEADKATPFSIDPIDVYIKGAFYVRAGLTKIIFLRERDYKDQTFLPFLLHELGHRLADEMSSSDWGEYLKIRGIKKDQKIYDKDWKISPDEDFAEVFKYLNLAKLERQQKNFIGTSYKEPGLEEELFISKILSRFNGE